ncbi:MAG: hypothetical protein LUD53_00035 [Clostridiales bacterium]|nr:hypothetical protein [Clostridiales bacterium]
MLVSVLFAAAAVIVGTAVLTRILMKAVVLGMVETHQIWDSLETDEHMAADL